MVARMKVLISAYTCEPGRGSEPGVGWNIVREIAKYHDVWVLTRPDDGREAIEAELALNPVPNLNFEYFTLPFWKDSLRLGQSGAMQIHYYLWQIQAYFVARRLHQQVNFDVMHHVTFVKYSSPSFISMLPTPFIWGPVGGGESAPKSFWKDFSLRSKVYETARSIVRTIGERDPFVRMTIRNSSIIRATTKDTVERLQKIGFNNVEILSESGLSAEEIAALGSYSMSEGTPVRFISIGRLLHWKGFHLGLRAFAQANIPDSEYWIVGDGPEEVRLRSLAESLGIAQQVKFWGRLKRDDTLNKLGECHVLVHPSLHDSGGWVCLEGMAAGRPIICLDLGGPGVQVSSETGIKVVAETPEQTVIAIKNAMNLLAADANLRLVMGEAGRKRVVSTFNWETKGQSFAQLYEMVAK